MTKNSIRVYFQCISFVKQRFPEYEDGVSKKIMMTSNYHAYKDVYHVKWWSSINIEEKVARIKEIIKRNKEIVDHSLSQEVQSENSLTKIKRMFQRKYPKASPKEMMQNGLEYMKKQFKEIFDSSDSMSTGSQFQTAKADMQDI